VLGAATSHYPALLPVTMSNFSARAAGPGPKNQMHSPYERPWSAQFRAAYTVVTGLRPLGAYSAACWDALGCAAVRRNLGLTVLVSMKQGQGPKFICPPNANTFLACLRLWSHTAFGVSCGLSRRPRSRRDGPGGGPTARPPTPKTHLATKLGQKFKSESSGQMTGPV
jgi:hypothetical protein